MVLSLKERKRKQSKVGMSLFLIERWNLQLLAQRKIHTLDYGWQVSKLAPV